MSLAVCPVWFLLSLVKNALQRPGWWIAMLRLVVPLLTLALVVSNDAMQRRIAGRNAATVIAACEQYRATRGTYPRSLDELVPQYLPSIPRSKYCLAFGDFDYFDFGGHPMLVWCIVPPFGHRTYNFDDHRSNYID